MNLWIALCKLLDDYIVTYVTGMEKEALVSITMKIVYYAQY